MESRDPTTSSNCETIDGGNETDGGRDEIGGRDDTTGGDGTDARRKTGTIDFSLFSLSSDPPGARTFESPLKR